MTIDLNRRNFLRVAGGVFAAAVPLIEGCVRKKPVAPSGPTVTTGISGGRNVKVKLPSYVPLANMPQPDLPGTADGLVSPGYLRYPTSLIKSVPVPPGKGGAVHALTISIDPPPTPLGENVAWQQVNRELGVELSIPPVSGADFLTRLSATAAGSDLPDLITVSYAPFILANLGDFLQAACEDLTPYLSGDAIETYPNLANIPSFTWQSSAFNNKIATIPLATNGRRASAPILVARLEDLDKAGITRIGSADELTGVAKQLNNPGTRWAFGATGILAWLVQVFGGPCIWREAAGRFTKDWETQEYREAVAYHRELWDAGLFHPDSAALAGFGAGVQYHAGKFVFAAYLNWSTLQLTWDLAFASKPKFTPRPVLPFNHDGNGRAPQFLPSPATALVALKKANSDRIKELLGVLNYLAAPIGTSEHLLLRYGVEGADFTRDAVGDPLPTQQGRQDLTVPWKYLVGPPDYLYDTTSPDVVPVTHLLQAEHFALTLGDPTLGLYSPTDASKGAGLQQAFHAGLNEILFGQRPVSALDNLVKVWRANGGDQIRTEYAEAFEFARA